MTDDRKDLPSASGFSRIVLCPGSPTLEKLAGKSESTSEVANSGTDIHDAIAADDLSELGLTEEKVATRLTTMTEQALLQWCQENNFTGAKKIIREERFWIQNRRTKKDVCSAKPDFAAIEGGQCICIDLKSGFKAVTPAAGNWQLKVQLVALDMALGPFERARVAIAQHRLGPDKFDACDYTRDDIDQAYVEILFYLRRAENPQAERVPGAEQCRYCSAKAICPEYAAYSLMPMVQAKMMDAPKKGDIVRRVAMLPIESLAFIESRRTAAENLFEAVKSRLKTLSKEELTSVGYELKPSGSTRFISNLGALWAILDNNRLCSPEEFREMCKISIGTLEEKLVTRIKLRDQVTTEVAEKTLDALIAPVVGTSPKADSLRKL